MNPFTAQPVLTAAALLVYVLAAGWYLAAFGRARQRPGAEQPTTADAVLVQGGLLVAVVSFISPLAYWSDIYLWVRAMQDVTLAFIAPALVAAGRPWLVIRRAPATSVGIRAESIPPDELFAGNEPFTTGNELSVATVDRPDLLSRRSEVVPIIAVVVFNAAWLGLHWPFVFDAAQGNWAVRLAENLCYLGTGLWFWLEVAGARGRGEWHAPLRRLGMITATVAAGTVLGMALVFGANVAYPAYYNSAHHIMTVLDDQQLSGAVLWMGVLPSLVVAGVALLNSWLNEEEADKPADVGRLVMHRRASGWPTRPGYAYRRGTWRNLVARTAARAIDF